MSEIQSQEVEELKAVRKNLTMGIVWATVRYGTDSKAVCIARSALRNLDEYIAERGYDSALMPAIAAFAPKAAKSRRKKA